MGGNGRPANIQRPPPLLNHGLPLAASFISGIVRFPHFFLSSTTSSIIYPAPRYQDQVMCEVAVEDLIRQFLSSFVNYCVYVCRLQDGTVGCENEGQPSFESTYCERMDVRLGHCEGLNGWIEGGVRRVGCNGPHILYLIFLIVV